MKTVQRLGMIFAMTAIAGGSGFYMQNKHGNGASSQGPVPASITPTLAVSSATVLPSLGEDVTVSIPVKTKALTTGVGLPDETATATPVQLVAVDTTTDPGPSSDIAEVAIPACSVDMVLVPQPGAMLDIGLLAPCHADQRVVIRHSGLVVTGLTSAAGSMVATIPALASPAEVKITLLGGAEVSETATVPDLARFSRIGVQWMANDAFQVHAYENGAGFGDSGHVSAANPRRPSERGGFVSVLGDDRADRPLLAEVYTFPADVKATDPSVVLSVEAAVTEGTCGREILGETIELVGGKLGFRDLTIDMPGCDAIGEFMVLDQPLQVASN